MCLEFFGNSLRVFDFTVSPHIHPKVEKILAESLNAKLDIRGPVLYIRSLSRSEITLALLLLRFAWVFTEMENPWMIEAFCKISEITPLQATAHLRLVSKSWYYLVQPFWISFTNVSNTFKRNRRKYLKTHYQNYISKNLKDHITVKVSSIKVLSAGNILVKVVAYPCRYGRQIHLVYTRNNWKTVELQSFYFNRVINERYEIWGCTVRGDFKKKGEDLFLAVKLLDDDGSCVWDNNGGVNFKLESETLKHLYEAPSFELE